MGDIGPWIGDRNIGCSGLRSRRKRVLGHQHEQGYDASGSAGDCSNQYCIGKWGAVIRAIAGTLERQIEEDQEPQQQHSEQS